MDMVDKTLSFLLSFFCCKYIDLKKKQPDSQKMQMCVSQTSLKLDVNPILYLISFNMLSKLDLINHTYFMLVTFLITALIRLRFSLITLVAQTFSSSQLLYNDRS